MQQFIDSSKQGMSAVEPRAARLLFIKNCPAEFDKALTSSVVSDARSLTGSFYSAAMSKGSQTELLCQLDAASTNVHLAAGRPTGHGKHCAKRATWLSYVAGVIQRHATETFLF